MKHFIYVRVSTQKQDYDQQLNAIKNYCKSNGIDFDNTERIEETISRKVNYKKRKLNEIFNILQKDDVLIISEFTRIGANFKAFLDFIEDCRQVGVTIIECKNNLKIYPKEVQDMLTQMFVFMLGIGSQMEIENIRIRTINGIAASKEKKGWKNEKWGKEKGLTVKGIASMGGKVSGANRKNEANNDPANMYICQNSKLFADENGKVDFHSLLMNMRSLNMKTSGGNEFTMNRLRCMYIKLDKKGLICF